MKNIKKIIPILIIFLTIGFAAVNYTLSLDGDTNLTGDLEDFKVYFSRVLINGVEDNSIVSSATQLDFSNKLTNIGQEYVVDYDITNGSKYFDASISMTCTEGTEYLSITNTFDTSNLTSLETRTGKLVLKRLKSLASNDSQFTKITCTINAQPIERETLGEGTITNPVNPYYIGREVFIGTEGFNIISEQENTITMLAQYNLGTNYRQSTTENSVNFSEGDGWEYTPGPKEIDIQEWSTNPKTYINEYVSYLHSQTGDSAIKGNLITLNELITLGCNAPSDYSYQLTESTRTCVNSSYKSWLINGQGWWTRSAYSSNSIGIWLMFAKGDLGYPNYGHTCGVRPTITISKKTADLLIKYPKYKVGDEIIINKEIFNVIRDNGTTVTMLARYNIGPEYKQSSASNKVTFTDTTGWEYTPGPKEIDIQTWSTNPKNLVNGYVDYLKTETGSSQIKGNLITLAELESIGCKIPTNYDSEQGENEENCQNLPYSDWIITDQEWWSRSADASSATKVWRIMHNSKSRATEATTVVSGIRPVITISKDALK